MDAAIARIESANPKINAGVAEYFDKTRRRAKTAPPASPLSGTPCLIKDLYEIKGEITTSGSRLGRHIAAQKTVCWRRRGSTPA